MTNTTPLITLAGIGLLDLFDRKIQQAANVVVVLLTVTANGGLEFVPVQKRD